MLFSDNENLRRSAPSVELLDEFGETLYFVFGQWLDAYKKKKKKKRKERERDEEINKKKGVRRSKEKKFQLTIRIGQEAVDALREFQRGVPEKNEVNEKIKKWMVNEWVSEWASERVRAYHIICS